MVRRLLPLALGLVACSSSNSGTGSGYYDTVVPLTFLATNGLIAPIQNQPYAVQFSAAGGRPPYTWTLTSGSPPAGTRIQPSGLWSGKPTGTGSYAFEVTVTDTKGAQSGGQWSGTMNTTGTVPFDIATFTLPPYGLNQDFGFEPAFEGGTPPYTFTMTGLPPGVTYDPATGTMMGSPTASGSFEIGLTLKDSTGKVANGTPVTVPVDVNPPAQMSGGGGGGGSGGFDCSPYDATVPAGFEYACQFAYTWQDDSVNPPVSGSGSFRVSFDVQCLAPATNGTITLSIVDVNGSDAFFGTVGKTQVNQGSVLLMPASPPTTPGNPAQVGQGLTIDFPNGAVLGTSNGTVGDLNVLGSQAPFTIVSNSPAPAWSLVNLQTGASFEPSSNPKATVTATSWNCNHN
jgi:putative Ig domain-containing protein